MVTATTLVPGKYYEVKYSNATYLCKAYKKDMVEVRWVIENDGTKRPSATTGAVMGSMSIRQITHDYYWNGQQSKPINNQEAKQLLEKEW